MTRVTQFLLGRVAIGELLESGTGGGGEQKPGNLQKKAEVCPGTEILKLI